MFRTISLALVAAAAATAQLQPNAPQPHPILERFRQRQAAREAFEVPFGATIRHGIARPAREDIYRRAQNTRDAVIEAINVLFVEQPQEYLIPGDSWSLDKPTIIVKPSLELAVSCPPHSKITINDAFNGIYVVSIVQPDKTLWLGALTTEDLKPEFDHYAKIRPPTIKSIESAMLSWAYSNLAKSVNLTAPQFNDILAEGQAIGWDRGQKTSSIITDPGAVKNFLGSIKAFYRIDEGLDLWQAGNRPPLPQIQAIINPIAPSRNAP